MANSQLVIGYGNPLRADDGLGWNVAQQLAASPLPGDTSVIATHQLTPELAEPISEADLVIFVDARVGDQPGRIGFRHLAPVGGRSPSFSHDVDPPALLELARLLFGACPAGAVVSVDGGDFGYGTAFSPNVEAAFPLVIERVRAVLVEGLAALDSSAAPLDPSVERRILSCTS